jgi:hypothetical protein
MAVTINGSTGLTFNNGSLQDVGGVGTSGQTWQDVTGSRTGNVTYTNTTGKPIMVSIVIQLVNSSMGLNIGGVAIQALGESGSAPGYVCGIVPNGIGYSVSTPSSISTWSELR